MKLWQLKKLSTGESLNEPQELPENWGPIFGLHGFAEKINDLSWLGETYSDLGWFVVGEKNLSNTPIPMTKSEIQWEEAKKRLKESDWSVLPDVPMSSGQKVLWMEYRKALREVRLQVGFPENIEWPKVPE